MDYPDFYTWQSTGKVKGYMSNATVGDLKKEYNDLTDKLNNAENSYDAVCKNAAQFKINGDDINRMQAVVNGNYEEASAVLMAYNNAMITSSDIEKSKWKSLDNLKSVAKDVAKETGSNLIFGLSNGVDTYKNQIKDKGLEAADLYLSTFKEETGINSPSKKMYENGVYLIQGLVNGLSDMAGKVSSPIKLMIDKLREKLNPLKSVFNSAFNGIWEAIKTPMNFVLGKVEAFVNTFNSGLSRVGGKILNGVDVAANIVANVGNQNLKLPRLAKGGIVKAPTLAVVGDNAGANSGNPEVISPLNKLQTMINSSNGEDVVILKQMLDYLKRIYEMFVIFRNNGGNHYEFVAKINGSEIFDEIVKQNELYKKRHGGKSAFA